MSVANVGSKWDGGDLVFVNQGTGATVLAIKAGGDVELGTAQFVKGQIFTACFPSFAAADVAKIFFVAPAACELVSAIETHATVAGQAGTLTIEKCTAGEAATQGDVVLASAWDLTSTVNTAVSKAATATGVEQLAAGDALRLKVASGNAASLAGASITCTMKWL